MAEGGKQVVYPTLAVLTRTEQDKEHNIGYIGNGLMYFRNLTCYGVEGVEGGYGEGEHYGGYRIVSLVRKNLASQK